MTLKRIIFRSYVRLLEQWTMAQPAKVCLPTTDGIPQSQTDILTVAFNNIELIEWQTRLLRKFMRSAYTQIVVDNSTRKEVREQMQEFCKNNGILYIGIPKNALNRIGPSYSHAMAVNYAYRKVIASRSASFFMLLDHDLFPMREIDVPTLMENSDVYGLKMNQDPASWYLHPKVMILRQECIRKRGVDFMPAKYHGIFLDAGGGNWKRIYQYLPNERCRWVEHELQPLRAGADWHSDTLEYLDDRRWLHTINGSCWKAIAGEEEKLQLIRDLLANA